MPDFPDPSDNTFDNNGADSTGNDDNDGSDDFFEAPTRADAPPSPQSGDPGDSGSASDTGLFRPVAPKSSTASAPPSHTPDPLVVAPGVDIGGAQGIGFLRAVEGPLEEVPECGNPLLKILDGFIPYSADNFRHGVIEYARLAEQHLQNWDVNPTPVQMARFDRLKHTGDTLDNLADAVDDLKVSAGYLAAVRPEDMFDAGSWGLYRDVRRAIRSNDIELVGQITHKLDHLVDGAASHWLAPYLDRLNERYARLIGAAVRHVEPVLAVEADISNVEAVAQALVALDSAAAKLERWQAIHPHALLGAMLEKFSARRHVFLPTIQTAGEAALSRNDLSAINATLRAIATIGHDSPSAQQLAPLPAALLARRDAIVAELQRIVEAGLAAETPGPMWDALRQLAPVSQNDLPAELTATIAALESAHGTQVAQLDADAQTAMKSAVPDDVGAVVRRLSAYLDHNPTHEFLGARKGELVAHRELLLAKLARKQQVRDAFDALQRRVETALADGTVSAVALREIIDEIDATTIVPNELKAPLRERLQRRAARIEALASALESAAPDAVEALLVRAEAGATPETRAILADRLSEVRTHRADLMALLASLDSLAALHQRFATVPDPAVVAADAGPVIAQAVQCHATCAPSAPVAVSLKQSLAEQIARAEAVAAHLPTLAALPMVVRSALGESWRNNVRADETAAAANSTVPNAPAFSAALDAAHAELATAASTLAVTVAVNAVVAEHVAQLAAVAPAVSAAHAEASAIAATIEAKSCDAATAQRASTLAETPHDRAAVASIDEWLEFNGDLVRWFDSQKHAFAALANSAAAAAAEWSARKRRLRNRLLAAAAAVVLVAAGIFGVIQWQELQRQHRAQTLLAKAQTASQADATAVTAPVVTAVTEFLDAGQNRADFVELVAAYVTLESRHELLAGLEAREIAVRHHATTALASAAAVELSSALEAVVALQTDTPLPAQSDRIEPLRVELQAALVRGLADFAISAATSIEAIDAAETAIRERLTALDDAAVTAALTPTLDALAARRNELKLAAVRDHVRPDSIADEAGTDTAIAALRAQLDRETDPAVRAEIERLLAVLSERKAYFLAILELRDRLQALIAGTELPNSVAAAVQAIRATAADVPTPPGLSSVAEVLRPELAVVDTRVVLLREAIAAKQAATSVAVEAVITSLRDAVRGDGAVHGPALRPHIAELMTLLGQLRRRESDRDRHIADLIARGRALLTADRLDPLDAFLRDAASTIDDAGATAPAPAMASLRDVVADVERRREFVARAIAHGERVLSQSNAALAGDSLDAVQRAATAVTAFLAESPLSWQLAELTAMAVRLAVASVVHTEKPGLQSELPAEIATVIEAVTALAPAEAPPELRAAVEASRRRLTTRHEFFVRRDNLRERIAGRVAATTVLADPLRAEISEWRDEATAIETAPAPSAAFGAAPRPDTRIAADLTALERRVALLDTAEAGLKSTTTRAVIACIDELEAALATSDGAPHRPSLAPALAQLRWLREFIEAYEAGLKQTTAEGSRRAIEDLQRALAEPTAAPLVAHLEPLLRNLAQHAEALQTQLSLAAVGETLEPTAALNGKVERGVRPSQVYCFHNDGAPQALEVDETGGFALIAPLEPGTNEFVVSPTLDPAHAGAATHRIVRLTPTLTLSGPTRVETRDVKLRGTVRGARLNTVFMFVNGVMQRAEVIDGQFETVAIVTTGENEIIASPVQRPDHAAAVRHTVFSNVARSAVVVTLTWEEEGPDVDLRVQQPNGVTVSWQRKNPGGLNGRLDVDNTTGFGPECYTFSLLPGQRMPSGAYRVFIVYYQGDRAVNWTVRIVFDEGMPTERVEERTGRIERPNKDRPILVYEFTVD